MRLGRPPPPDVPVFLLTAIKVSGPFVETSCVFQCIKNIINAEMWAWKNDSNKKIIFNEGISLWSESLKLLNPDLVNIQVTCWFYRQTLVCVDISRPFVSLSLFLGGGGGVQKVFFSLFWNNKASSKYIYTLNGVHICLFQYKEFERKGPSL